MVLENLYVAFRRSALVMGVVIGGVCSTALWASESPGMVENFRLTTHTGRPVELYRFAEAPAVVLYVHSVGCPIVRQSMPTFNRIREEFEAKGVQFLLINPNPQDARADFVENAKAFGITVPILEDRSGIVTAALGSTRTAEAIVIEPAKDWRIAYRGAMDDTFDYGGRKRRANKMWLRDALNSVLAGETVTVSSTRTIGCLIGNHAPASVDYAKEVAPILAEKCVSCHRTGGTGPFAMRDHGKVAGWAPMIREVIRTRRMPPWHADSAYGTFDSDRGLTVDEERTLITWIERGAARGAGEDPLAMQISGDPSGWTLGDPDLVMQLPEPERLPAEGVLDYRYVTVPTGLMEDKWVRGLELKPTNAAVVHHALVFIKYPPAFAHIQPEAEDGLNGYFGAYLPGMKLKPFPDNSGLFLPAGSEIIFQMHYNATGKEEVDQTRMALYFHDETPERVFIIEAATETDFSIPPYAADHETRTQYQFREDAMLYGLSPHMHYRGGRFAFSVQPPEGAREMLLNVPFYEFDWQPMYFFEAPKAMARGTRILMEGAFDNSAFNPKNPDPSETVHFGEQSFEEMFIGYVAYTRPYSADDFQKRAY